MGSRVVFCGSPETDSYLCDRLFCLRNKKPVTFELPLPSLAPPRLPCRLAMDIRSNKSYSYS